MICYIICIKGGDLMSEKEMIKISIEEFSRIQDYMEVSDPESVSYKMMYKRYSDLKAILESSGINLEVIDRIKK